MPYSWYNNVVLAEKEVTIDNLGTRFVPVGVEGSTSLRFELSTRVRRFLEKALVAEAHLNRPKHYRLEDWEMGVNMVILYSFGKEGERNEKVLEKQFSLEETGEIVSNKKVFK